jgi:hypothetical protein
VSRLVLFALACAGATPFVALGVAASGPVYSSGAPPGFAGDQTSGSAPVTCAACHSSFALNEGPGGVTVEAPELVAPGETVAITVTVDNQTQADGTRRQGFEVAVRVPGGDHVGTLGLGTDGGTRFAQGNAAYVTHDGADPEQTEWTFTWTAPPAEDAPASVRLYLAANAANGDGGTGGDRVFATAADVTLAGTSALGGPDARPLALGPPRPNPARAGATVDLRLAAPARVAVRVVDGVGRTVRHVASGRHTAGVHALAVPTDGLAPGTYFVVADGPGGRRRAQPLVVAR